MQVSWSIEANHAVRHHKPITTPPTRGHELYVRNPAPYSFEIDGSFQNKGGYQYRLVKRTAAHLTEQVAKRPCDSPFAREIAELFLLFDECAEKDQGFPMCLFSNPVCV